MMDYDSEDEEEYLGLRPTRLFPHSENDPMLSNVVIPHTDRSRALVEKLRKPCPPIDRPTIFPLFDVETYIFMANIRGEEAEDLRRRNPPLPPAQQKPRHVFNKYDVPSDLDWVKVEMKVTPSGRVKVSMCVPMEPLKPFMYGKDARVPPIELRIRAANKFGCDGSSPPSVTCHLPTVHHRYPMSVLESMVERNTLVTSDQYQKEQADFVKEVFGVMKPSSSKPTKVHEVTRAKRTVSKRRYVDFYNLTSLLDYYEETHVIEKVRT